MTSYLLVVGIVDDREDGSLAGRHGDDLHDGADGAVLLEHRDLALRAQEP